MRFYIPGALREFAGGRTEVEVATAAATLNQALSVLWMICPGMRDRVVTEQGDLRAHINIFVGDENIRYTGGFATPVTAESAISIVPAVSGGGKPESVGTLRAAATTIGPCRPPGKVAGIDCTRALNCPLTRLHGRCQN